MDYPFYRQLPGGRSLYRIDSQDHFTEVQFVGSLAMVHRVSAKTYPERVRLNDMLLMSGGHFIEADAASFEAALYVAEGGGRVQRD